MAFLAPQVNWYGAFRGILLVDVGTPDYELKIKICMTFFYLIVVINKINGYTLHWLTNLTWGETDMHEAFEAHE